MAVDQPGDFGEAAAEMDESGEAAAARTFITTVIGAALFTSALLFILL